MPNKKSEADKATEAAAERTAALNEADAQFREDVAKAAEKRDKVRAKYPDLANLAEQAWNEVKSEEDPLYRDIDSTFRQKLDTAVTAIEQTGNADIVGLEEFEKEVVRLIKDRGDIPGQIKRADLLGQPEPVDLTARRVDAVKANRATADAAKARKASNK